MDIIQSEDFDEFYENVADLTEYYLENRYSGDPEDLEEALLHSPIPFMLNSGCQTLEEFIAMYQAWSIYTSDIGHEAWKEKTQENNEQRQKIQKALREIRESRSEYPPKAEKDGCHVKVGENGDKLRKNFNSSGTGSSFEFWNI